MRRLLLGAAVTAAAGALAYAAYRIGRSYKPDDPLGGLAAFADAVKDGMAERERDLRDALGLDVGAPAATEPGDGRAPRPGPHSRPERAGGLTVAEARDLLLDPTGPRRAPDRPGEGR